MRDSTVEFKLKVFISSAINDRFTIVRKSLKELLLATNMTSVYVFETTGSSSQHVVDSYLQHIDDSTVCIFLINNADEIPVGVQLEHKRAKDLGKRIHYIFCNENQAEATQMQKEIIESQREKIKVVSDFSDFTKVAYESVMQDIVSIYCLPPIEQKNPEEDSRSSNLFMQNIESFKMDKNLFKSFDATKAVLINIIDPNHGIKKENKETSEIDEYAKELLTTIIGDRPCDKKNLVQLMSSVAQAHEDYLKKVIELRYCAIESYFDGNVELCIENLMRAHESAKDDARIPNWIINDIVIDWRNMRMLNSETKNITELDNEVQALLRNNIESVYYPLLDRVSENYKEDLLKKNYTFMTDSPYTTHYGGWDGVFRDIASCFFIAVMFGSLTQILCTRLRIIDVLVVICANYREHDLYLLLIKMMLLEQKNSDLEKTIRSYNQPTGTINGFDVESLINSIETLPIHHERIKSSCLLLKYFGYYFTDEQYKIYCNRFYYYCITWLEDENHIVEQADFLLDTISYNEERMEETWIISFIVSLFEKGYSRWYDKAIKILGNLDIIRFDDKNQYTLLTLLEKIVSDSGIQYSCPHIKTQIIIIRKQMSVDVSNLDKLIEREMPDYYMKEYSLDIFSNSLESNLLHITQYLDDIRNQNDRQGKDGIFYSYGDNPYGTILNIINMNNLLLPDNVIKDITNISSETLLAPKQSISAKNAAIELLIFLRNRFLLYPGWQIFITDLLKNTQSIYTAHIDDHFNNNTLLILKFHLSLLKNVFVQNDIHTALIELADLSQMNAAESIEALEYLCNYLSGINYKTIDPLILVAILRHVTMMSTNEHVMARFNAIKCLILLTQSEYQKPALEQLSRLMENSTYEIKASILARVKQIESGEKSIVDYIIQKGKVDNHYLVRKIALKKSDSKEISNEQN